MSLSLKLKAGKMENQNSLPDLLKKMMRIKKGKLPKLRKKLPKCVNKWVNEESIIEYCKLGKLPIKLNWLNWFSSQFPYLKNQNFHWQKLKIRHENK